MEDAMRASILAGLLLLAACSGGPQNQHATLSVSMTGIQEVPSPGPAGGNGTVEIHVVPADGQVCWNLYAREIGPATGAAVHRGAEGVAGPVVLPLTTPDAAGHSQGCAIVDQMLAREIAYQGYGFYVNVPTAAHPGGAIRGQLRGGPVRNEPRQAATP
jgi:hypothetical protein